MPEGLIALHSQAYDLSTYLECALLKIVTRLLWSIQIESLLERSYSGAVGKTISCAILAMCESAILQLFKWNAKVFRLRFKL